MMACIVTNNSRKRNCKLNKYINTSNLNDIEVDLINQIYKKSKIL